MNKQRTTKNYKFHTIVSEDLKDVFLKVCKTGNYSIIKLQIDTFTRNECILIG